MTENDILFFENIYPKLGYYIFKNYLIIALKESSYGCMDCIVNRINDNQKVKINPDFTSMTPKLSSIDIFIVEIISKAAIEDKGKYYYSYDLFKKNYDKRLMIPYPQCPYCTCEESHEINESLRINSGKELVTWDNYRKKGFEELVEIIEENKLHIVHPVFGLFKGVYRGIADCMPLIALDAKLGSRTYDAYGREATYKQSYYIAILEALERYHSVYPYFKSSFYSSEKELEDKHIEFVSLKKYIHYTEKEYKNPNFEMERYNEEKNIYWRYVYSCRSKKYILAPEQCYYFSNEQVYKDSSEKRYLYDSSNGTALGSTYEEAAISAMYELIERDSFMVHWYTKSAPVQLIGIEKIDNLEIKMMLTYLKSYSIKVHVFDITLETGIPAIWVLLENLSDDLENKFAFYTAAGSNMNPINALKSALIEASTAIKVFTRFATKKYSKEELIAMHENYEEVKKLEDHLYLYSSPKMREELNFALNTNRQCEFTTRYKTILENLNEKMTQEHMLSNLLERILAFHEEVYICNLTSPYLKQMEMNCTKVSVPTMHNISFGYQYQNINKGRLEQAIKLNGLKGSLLNINYTPHPFP